MVVITDNNLFFGVGCRLTGTPLFSGPTFSSKEVEGSSPQCLNLLFYFSLFFHLCVFLLSIAVIVSFIIFIGRVVYEYGIGPAY